ncbi:MAG: hypothetical protein F6K26_56985, partial [Moorea sp. SIO2I5]|nr:hypothetical protein [Moorena sp. SIO2I5]
MPRIIPGIDRNQRRSHSSKTIDLIVSRPPSYQHQSRLKLNKSKVSPNFPDQRNFSHFLMQSLMESPIPDSRFPIPNSRFPIPNSQFPIPDSQFPIPDSRFPIPDSQFSILNSQFSIPDKFQKKKKKNHKNNIHGY